MKQTFFAIALLVVATVPAKAETAFWTTCDFQREGSLDSDSFGLFASGGGTFVRHGSATPVTWLETGDTIHVFASEEWPRAWLISFNAEERVAVAYSEGIPIRSTSCRGGAE